jgi:hypothetical protein
MNRRNLICAVMLVLSLVATHHVQSQENSPKPTTESKNSENALEILSRSTQLIEAAPAFLVKGKSGGELILGNGQLVESGTTFTAIFKRPSQLKLLLKSRRGHKTTMIFDGETITLASSFQGKQIYGTAPQLGDVNDSLDFMFNQTGSPRELEHFLSPEWTQSLSELRPSVYVGKSAIDGVWCDHLAIQSDTKDGQVWIARRGEPVPWRILIRHREEPLQPRYWLQFDEWDFSPDISESTFKFTPPEDAVKFQYLQD